jgi:hypothetical protein
MPKGPQGRKSLEDMSQRERLLFGLACFVAAAGMGLGAWKNPYVQFYLHRFDPIESIILIAMILAALFWVVANAPRS